MSKYKDTIELIDNNIDSLIDEMIFLQHTQTSILKNDNYLIKDKDTQAIFESLLCNYQEKKSPNNHLKAYDLKHKNNKISIKSGSINNNSLTFSYSRTTEHKNLADKIKYLSSFENLILGIASERLKTSNSNTITKTRYYIYYLEASFIDLNKMEWTETPNQYLGVDLESDITVDIKKKLSDQPWITVPLDKITFYSAMTVSISNLNNRKYLVIQREDSGERLHFDIYQHRKKLKDIKGLQKCLDSTKKALMD